MDIKQMLPVLLKGRLGETEQALLKASASRDPAAISAILSKMQPRPRVDAHAVLMRLLPADTLGRIVKYFSAT